jgi:SAM-dependent methyltransferase
MLRMMTKADVWGAMDRGFLNTEDWGAGQWSTYSIKQMQDAVLLSMLDRPQGLDILEVGGGKSRTLPLLCPLNRCVNVDPVEGTGHGPIGIDPAAVPWRHVFRPMGQTEGEIADASIDIVYSISVIEHVFDFDQVDAVFADCARVLRPGGRMIHLIDAYLADPDRNNAGPRRVAGKLREILGNGRFRPVGAMVADDEVFFRGAWATNPDPIMYVWNQMAPGLAELRAEAQACSFVMEGART